jgi:hypothetical protein
MKTTLTFGLKEAIALALVAVAIAIVAALANS